MSETVARSRHRSACVWLMAWLLAVACPRCHADDVPLGTLAEIAKAYKIEITADEPTFPVTTTHGVIDGQQADKQPLLDYIRLFAPEFSLYPADLVQRAQLQRVVLCSELLFAGQRRNAIPDYEHNTLYLDVSRGTHSKPYLRKVIHHEFFHIIDYRDDLNVYRDERWVALNPVEVRYGSGGRLAQDLRETSLLTTKFPGFLNHYSTTAVEEDKAEVFAVLLVDPAYVDGRCKDDRVLEAKVGRMKELLAAFCPQLNDQFWVKVRVVKRTDE